MPFFYQLLFFFQNIFFRKILSGIPSELQTVWILIMPNNLSAGPDLGPKCLHKLSADDTSKQKVKVGMVFRKVK